MRIVNSVKAIGFGAAKFRRRGTPTATSIFSVCLAVAGGLSFATIAAVKPAVADSLDPVTAYIYSNAVYTQSSNSAPVSPDVYYFNMGVYFNDPASYSGGSVSYPAGTQVLPASPGSNQYDFSSSYYSPFSAFQTAYPFGTYNFSVSPGTEPAAASVIQYGSNYFTNVVPYVMNFNNLNGLNVGADFTVNTNSFVADPSASVAYAFFAIYDANTFALIYQSTPVFLDPSTTSIVIPANTLLAGGDYFFDLDFSNRVNGYDTADATFTTQGFDLHTEGYFTTGQTPLPPTWSLMLSGLVGLVIARFRRAKTNTIALAAA